MGAARDQAILRELHRRGLTPGDATRDQFRDAAKAVMRPAEKMRAGVAVVGNYIKTEVLGVVVPPEVYKEREGECKRCPFYCVSADTQPECLRCGCSGASFERKLADPNCECPDTPPRWKRHTLTINGQPTR